jgi:hypothetical protein
MSRTYLWRSVVGQRLATDFSPDESQRFGRWLSVHAVTDADLIDLIRD